MNLMLNKLGKIQENDLTREVIVPLFERMYGCRVCFTGGANEKGRDLIVYYKNPLDEPEYIGVQVKRKVVTSNSNSNSFQQLVNQLSQMRHEAAVCPTSLQEVYFSKKVFITSYEIPEKVYDTHHGAMKALENLNVSIIDGKKLLLLVEQYIPEKLSFISGDNSAIGDALKTNLTNNALMDALSFKDNKQICDIYCETQLSIGNKQTDRLINSEFNAKPDKSFRLNNYIQAEELHKLNSEFFDRFGSTWHDDKMLEKIGEELTYRQDLLYTDKVESDVIATCGQSIQDRIKSSRFVGYFPHGRSFDSLEDFCFNGFRDMSSIPNDDYMAFMELISELQGLFSKRQKSDEERIEIRSKVAELPVYHELPFSGNKIVEAYKERHDSLQRMAKKQDNLRDVKNYLQESQNVNFLIKIIDKYSSYFEITEKKNSSQKTLVKLSIHQVFDTKMNTLVLGDAGSGKTTNLQVYTSKLIENNDSRLTIFMTLNELANLAKVSEDKDIVYGVWAYLNKLQSFTHSIQSFRKHISSNETCIVLDSVDEAISQHQWVVDKLCEFVKLYPHCQVITSSRFTVEDVDKLNFVNVSLLPFDSSQKREFFLKWFENDHSKVNEIMNHLGKYSGLDQVVTNPLSATIMATLQGSNVPLPATEAQLYKKRFELLSGMFDKFKGVNRMVTAPEVILNAIRQLAYQMHLDDRRELEREDIISILANILPTGTDPTFIFKELCSPCEILLVNPNGTFGFGHLRFQEYLVSEQLVHIRTAPYDRFLKSPWWHDSLVLYAQHAHEINWLIDYICQDADLTLSCHNLAREMILFRDVKERDILVKRLESAIAVSHEDKLNSTLFDIDYDDFDTVDMLDY